MTLWSFFVLICNRVEIGTAGVANPPSPEAPAAVRASSVYRLVADILRGGPSLRAADRSPSDLSEQAAVGAAISILSACLAEEGIGPLPELTAGLVQIILTPVSATE